MTPQKQLSNIMKISIRPSIVPDLEVFYQNQIDPKAKHMAAFTPKDPSDRNAYITKWIRLMINTTVHMQSILVENKVVGCVVKFLLAGKPEITYAIDKTYWGKGVTTEGVKQFLKIETTRPIYARVAFDNIASQRVLEKSNFIKTDTEINFANARGKDIEEFVYKLSL